MLHRHLSLLKICIILLEFDMGISYKRVQVKDIHIYPIYNILTCKIILNLAHVLEGTLQEMAFSFIYSYKAYETNIGITFSNSFLKIA